MVNRDKKTRRTILNKKMLIWFCMVLCIVAAIGSKKAFSSEPVIITADGEYVMGNGETMEVAEERAKKAAMQKAAEQAGAYVKSYTKVKNLALESDVIEVIANHSMKVEVIEKKKTVLGDVDAIRFYVKIKATMTQEEIEANFKKISQDQSIVESYKRLKEYVEKQNKEITKLKRQLELATAGDKQKIAKLISEEEKKYKASLWLERAQNVYNEEEQLKAYKKALELNPELVQAYAGIGETLSRTESKETLKEAIQNLDKAISMDENYAQAYALRAEILYKLKWLEYYSEKLNISEEKDYNARILKDISRALALNAPKKGDLYYLRASIYLDELQNAELERSQSEIIEQYLIKALNEIENARGLCKEKDSECLSKYYERKVKAYNLARNYWIRQNNLDKEKQYDELINESKLKANELKLQAEKLQEQKEEELLTELKKESGGSLSEFAKIDNYLNGSGWREKISENVTGLTRKEIEKMSKEEQDKIFEKIVSNIKQKISKGIASAEEYIFMSHVEASRQYFEKGIELIEKRKPEGIDALLLVHFYSVESASFSGDILNYLNKAKLVVDENLPEAQNALSLNEFIFLISEINNAKNDSAMLNFVKKLARLNKQQAEAFFWFMFASQISQQKAEIYERLDLPQKAREEYLYLCNTFKDDSACKNAERLKK